MEWTFARNRKENRMKRSLALMLVACSMLALAGLVHAQVGSTQGRASGQSAGSAQAAQGTVSGDASASAAANADARADLAKMKQQMETRAARTSAEARAHAEAKLEATAKRTDDAGLKGESEVASRLAKEFGITVSALMDEKTELGASWGQLMIAHTLSANSNLNVTVQQLFELRKDGMGWGQIAAGLGYKLGDAVSAVNSEGRVAGGQARADGKVAVIHGEGARSGLGMNAAGGLGLNAGHGAGVGAGLGVGGKIGH